MTLVTRTCAATALLVVIALAHLLVRYPAASAPMLDASGAGTLVTIVPTVAHVERPGSSLSPTYVPASLGLGATPESTAETLSQPLSAVQSGISEPLVDPALPLLTGPVQVPLQLQIPALKIKAPVLGVGLTLMNAMASPIGMRADDPVWQSVFWYRGGGIPGEVGTATFAGHYDDDLGRPAVFAFLEDLEIGDLIIVHDQRSGLDISFIVTETKLYTDQEAAVPAVLERVFGSKAVSGEESEQSDQLSHLTLITCAGSWIDGSFNHRLVVYATRASYPF